jgi:hypothetical protein
MRRWLLNPWLWAGGTGHNREVASVVSLGFVGQ